MDHDVRRTGKRNPREGASLLSIFTLFYAIPLFKIGQKDALNDEDIYEVHEKFSSKKLGNELDCRWQVEQKKGRNPSLLKVVVSCYGRVYLSLFIMQLCIMSALMLVRSYAFGKIVAYFKRDQVEISTSHASKYAALLITINLMGAIFGHTYLQYSIEAGLAIKSAFVALIYRKALRLKPSSFSSASMGYIVTLITKDVLVLETAVSNTIDLFVGVLQIVTFGCIVYARVGKAVFVAVGVMVIVIPLQVYAGRKASVSRLNSAKKTDDRLQVTKEAFSAISIIKMCTWEKLMEKTINNFRTKEMKALAVVFYLQALIFTFGVMSSELSYYLLITTYAWSRHRIEAETVYYINACDQSLRFSITTAIPIGIGQLADLYASFRRIRDFLLAEELEENQQTKTEHPKIVMRNASVKINKTEVLKDVSLSIGRGLTLVNGNAGSGKTTLLKTILKDHGLDDGEIIVEGSISYASQEPWLFPSSIKQNILFGQAYDEWRYRQVLEVCALNFDLDSFKNGDQTIVVGRGANLSKGQQVRINLARAAYKNSDIYLLDDSLSSLDADVSGYVFRKCIRGLLKDKIVVYVTHNKHQIGEMHGTNVVLVKNGTVLTNEHENSLNLLLEEEQVVGNSNKGTTAHNEVEKIPRGCQSEKLVNNFYHEEPRPGKVSYLIYLSYSRYAGGICVLIYVTALFVIYQASVSYAEKLLSEWVNLDEDGSRKNHSNHNIVKERTTMMTTYSIATLTAVAFVFIKALFTFYFCLKASTNLHKVLTAAIMNAHMYFFDGHFIGNIINRFSKDLATIDENLPFNIYHSLTGLLVFLSINVVIASVNVTFIISEAVLLAVLYRIQKLYGILGAMKRLESAMRSPMIGYLNATLEGLTTVRACEKQSLLIKEFDMHQDTYTSSYYMMQSSFRALSLLVNLVCTAFLAAVTLQLFLFTGMQAGDVGLAISHAMMLSGILQSKLRQLIDMEKNMVSVERVLEYAEVKTENRTTGETKKYWPLQGRIEFKEVSMDYRTAREQVLKGMSFVIEPRQKVGIVGRTGAGKSSIISALFRLYDFEGDILIDGIDIRSLSLDTIRSKISIIAQDPILFTGTIRSNMDPSDKHSDDVIWEALEKVELKGKISSLDEEICEGGSNFSAGQRQLFCLGKALITQNKIIILDEATASMDADSCALLQRIVKEKFASCTVLIVTHILHTIADSDNVMVVDSGRIVEYDSPQVLLENENGFFNSLMKQADFPDT